ncbi:MAG: double zinc ribbon domain-containing protein [Treponema sp.]|nr:double zinc ribbon domain-containing protein [Treponema sp.]
MEYLFPRFCGLCGTALMANENRYGLCLSCRPELDAGAVFSGGEPCRRCGRPLISESGMCLACRNSEEDGVDSAAAVYPYSGKYRRLLAAYKFGKNLALGRFFAEKILEALDRLPLSDMKNTALVPVPPRPGKIRKEGWDQIEYLAGLLERAGKKSPAVPPVSRCLRRLPSVSQKELDRKTRKKNLAGRITAVRKVPPLAVLFDDVMTTGSTLKACAGALKASGARRVYGICLFYD